MLLVYLDPLILPQTNLLNSWGDHVHYWPRSWAHADYYNAAIPTDYWLLFSLEPLAVQWLMIYSDRTRVVRTLFD
jgi:hypothetical protein